MVKKEPRKLYTFGGAIYAKLPVRPRKNKDGSKGEWAVGIRNKFLIPITEKTEPGSVVNITKGGSSCREEFCLHLKDIPANNLIVMRKRPSEIILKKGYKVEQKDDATILTKKKDYTEGYKRIDALISSDSEVRGAALKELSLLTDIYVGGLAFLFGVPSDYLRGKEYDVEVRVETPTNSYAADNSIKNIVFTCKRLTAFWALHPVLVSVAVSAFRNAIEVYLNDDFKAVDELVSIKGLISRFHSCHALGKVTEARQKTIIKKMKAALNTPAQRYLTVARSFSYPLNYHSIEELIPLLQKVREDIRSRSIKDRTNAWYKNGGMMNGALSWFKTLPHAEKEKATWFIKVLSFGLAKEKKVVKDKYGDFKSIGA